MGKIVKGALKIIGVVAAVGLTIATGGAGSPSLLASLIGVSAASVLPAAIVVGLGLLNAALAPRSPKVPTAHRDRLYTSIDPTTPRKIVFGTTAMRIDIR
jgi:hypothetical protein